MSQAVFTDQQLIQQFLNGNEKALETLLSRHKDKIYAAIFYMVKDTQMAEDIFQDTLIKIIHTLRTGHYNEEGKFLPWVLRIAHNLCIDHFRRQKRMPAFVSTADHHSGSSDDEFNIFNVLKVHDDSADVLMYKKQAYASVRQLINELPEDQKQTLLLRHYADLSFKEIAAIMDVSINTALGRMRYAIINMRKMALEKNLAL
jgi:RNA polymerase sigma-70 factor (ECF subfamily)